MRCPKCECEALDTQRFCGSCGSLLAPPSELPTSDSGGSRTPASRPRADGGFTPGTILEGRYRIVSLLGRGGMGEVYRADDLELGVAVALKFLPGAVATDPDRRARFLSEIRLARQIAHPNVCRVFDLGNAAGAGPPFLTMEYVDGEDLASLLRRIGRLPSSKALEIARQICAGLGAAHAHGVLHRDLKPANVMIDGRGRVRLMDFGIAVNASASDGAEVSGTPAYMAPEVLAGGQSTFQSDIHALGLVLYELYTGRSAYPAASMAEARAHKQRDPRPPSDLIPDLDPTVERVILRTLARDPAARPTSVAQVAVALPGGNLLEAAIRAGETPSPEMVAATATSGGPSPLMVWTLVALVLAGGAGAMALGSTGLLWRFAAPDRSPDALADRARALLIELGHDTAPVDRASGFEVDLHQLRYVQRRNPTRWRTVRPNPSYLRFWYRDSPQPLEAWRFPFLYGNISRITPADPPLDLVGMTLVRLDPEGRLTDLVAVLPTGERAGQSVARADWSAVLTQAGYEPSAWTLMPPDGYPPVYANDRAAWEGTWPGTRDLPMRLEAAALNGKVVYFSAVYPWTPPPRAPAPILTDTERASFLSVIVLFAIMVVGAVVVAQRNVRAGRGDRRGALRLSVFVFAAMAISWFFGESHVPTLWEVVLVIMGLSLATLAAAVSWIAYLAVEPFLRRRWPAVLVTWTRLVAGEFRDPLVGRDVLAGCAAATVLAMVAVLAFRLPSRLEVSSDIVFVDVYGIISGVQAVVPFLVWRAAQSVVAGLSGVLALVLLRLALRSPRAAAAAFTIGATLLSGAVTDNSWIEHTSSMIHFGVFAWLIVRFGLLAAIVQFYVWGLFVFFPMTTDLGAWYAGAGVTALLVVAAFTAWGLTAALSRSTRSVV